MLSVHTVQRQVGGQVRRRRSAPLVALGRQDAHAHRRVAARAAPRPPPMPIRLYRSNPSTRGEPIVAGGVRGAIITGRPELNRTACSASDDDTSSPASGCGTTVRSASRACWATVLSSRPVTEAKLAVAAFGTRPSLRNDHVMLRNDLVEHRADGMRPVAAFLFGGGHHFFDHRTGQSLAGERRNIAAVDTHMERGDMCVPQARDHQAGGESASPAAVPVSGSKSLRIAMDGSSSLVVSAAF